MFSIVTCLVYHSGEKKVQNKTECLFCTQFECAKNLGIGVSTLARQKAQFREHDDDIPVIGSGNYSSEEEKEIARLKRELRDAQDALDVLKNIGILGKV